MNSKQLIESPEYQAYMRGYIKGLCSWSNQSAEPPAREQNWTLEFYQKGFAAGFAAGFTHVGVDSSEPNK